MKILLTTDWWTPAVNGVVRSVTLLRRELMARGHDVKVLTLSSTSHSYEEDGVIYLGSLSADRVYPGARVRFAAWNRWMKALTDWRPDIIHSQCEFSTFLPAWRLARRWGADGALAARAGLLHDLYLYDPRSLPSWRQCFAHPVAAARNAAALEGALSPKEENCILAHMWPLSVRAPHSREAAAVCLADKLCSVAEVLHVWRRLALRRAMLSLVR